MTESSDRRLVSLTIAAGAAAAKRSSSRRAGAIRRPLEKLPRTASRIRWKGADQQGAIASPQGDAELTIVFDRK
jgi:hypothetical protein